MPLAEVVTDGIGAAKVEDGRACLVGWLEDYVGTRGEDKAHRLAEGDAGGYGVG